MQRRVGNTVVRLLRGDITTQEVDVIVNAANANLLGGGGVDGAIHRAAGPELLEECRAIRTAHGPCETAGAVITSACRLRARYIFHAVGPVWRGGGKGEAELLDRTYKRCLELAREQGIKTIAFPSISTGAFGYPVAQAAPVALAAIKEAAPSSGLDEIRMVLFKPEDMDIYEAAMVLVMGDDGEPSSASA